MSKRILFIVVDSVENKINEETKVSITPNLGKEDAYVFIKTPDNISELYYNLKDEANKIINDVNNFDYICLINNGSTLNENAKKMFADYQLDREDGIKEIYLPFVFTMVDDRAVILNKHIWTNVADTPGILDIDLATKQVDSTIFGAFIPTEFFFNPSFYDNDLKYYQQYKLLNHLADGNSIVLGIPKITLTVRNWDYKLENLEKEEKLKYFNQARSEWDRSKKKIKIPEPVQV